MPNDRSIEESRPDKKTGLRRIAAAFFYSLAGLTSAWRTEAAFRQELVIACVLSVLLVFLPLSLEWRGLLILATGSVLVVELLNSAVESVVDLASTEYHALAKRAKDIGSAAVFLSIVLALLLWGGAMLSLYRGQ